MPLLRSDHFPSGRLTRALSRLSPSARRELSRRIRARARAVGLGRQAISIRPVVLSRDQRRYLQRLCLALEWAAVEIFRRRWSDPALQALLPLNKDEMRWLRASYGSALRRPETLVGRMDLSGGLFQPGWREKVRILDCTLVGADSTYACQAAGRIIHEVVAPELNIPRLGPDDDLLELIIRRCVAHGQKIGRPRPVVALVEPPPAGEFAAVSRLLNDRGYATVAAGPAQVRARRGELHARGRRVDLVYRSMSLRRLAAMARGGSDLGGLRWAFRQNRVVSSPAGEIDHRGLLEALPDWVPSWVRAHIPWTRVLRPARTTDPAGRSVDLERFVLLRRRSLVLKSNRRDGRRAGVVGAEVSTRKWEREGAARMATPGMAVVQVRSAHRRERLPMLRRPQYLVGGIHATERGAAFRASYGARSDVDFGTADGLLGILVSDERQ